MNILRYCDLIFKIKLSRSRVLEVLCLPRKSTSELESVSLSARAYPRRFACLSVSTADQASVVRFTGGHVRIDKHLIIQLKPTSKGYQSHGMRSKG